MDIMVRCSYSCSSSCIPDHSIFPLLCKELLCKQLGEEHLLVMGSFLPSFAIFAAKNLQTKRLKDNSTTHRQVWFNKRALSLPPTVMPEGDEEEKQRLLIDGTNRVSQPATGSKFDDTSHPLGPGSSSSSSSSSSRSSSTTTKGSKSSRSSKKKEKQQVSQQAVDEGVGICRICECI